MLDASGFDPLVLESNSKTNGSSENSTPSAMDLQAPITEKRFAR